MYSLLVYLLFLLGNRVPVTLKVIPQIESILSKSHCINYYLLCRQ